MSLFKRFGSAIYCLGGAVLLFGCLQAVGCLSVAHAAVIVGDPTVAATAATDAGYDLIAAYGPYWGGMALVFGLASSILKANDSKHWIAQGRTLAVLVAAVGLAGTALQAHFSGSPWSGVAITAVMALFKLMQPTTTTPTSSATVATAASVLLVMLVGVAAMQPACTQTQRQSIETALWDCTAPQRAEAVAAVTPAVISVIRAATSADGKLIDLSTVKSAITMANLRSEAGVLLSCAAASAYAFLMQPAAPAPAGSAAAASLVIDLSAVRSSWSQVNAAIGGGKFKTSYGSI